MRVQAQILATILLAGVALAQSAPASQTVKENPPAQPSRVQSGMHTLKSAFKNPFAPKAKTTQPAGQTPAHAQVAAKPAAQAPAPKPTAPVAVQAEAVSKTKQPAPVKSKAVAKSKKSVPVQAKAHKPATIAPVPEKKPEAAPAVAQSAPPKLPSPGKRDPFLSPLAAAANKGPGANCTTGKRCLVVDQIVLKGVVQMKAGNLALVENSAKRPYYLHENDSLFNGSVVKITGDSVTFKEESNDVLGRPVSKEVVKKVSAPAV